MINKGKILETIEYTSLELDIDMDITVEISYTEESGTYYDNDGGGLPSSLDWFYKIISIYDTNNEQWLDHKKIKINHDDISDQLEEILSNNLNQDNCYDNFF